MWSEGRRSHKDHSSRSLCACSDLCKTLTDLHYELHASTSNERFEVVAGPVADAGFLEGGVPLQYCVRCAQTRTKNLETTSILIKTTPIFARCSDKLLACSTCQSICFRLKILQSLAKVSHSHRFLSSSTRKGGSITYALAYQQYFLVLDPAQRRVPWNPRNHPKPATATLGGNAAGAGVG